MSSRISNGFKLKSDEEAPRGSEKRDWYINWEEYFMAVALVSAQRSKDPVTQVGACIVNQDQRIVGVGYNGMPNGCSDDDLPWGKGSTNILETKKFYVCHAEMNAIVNKCSSSIKGCTMYVTLYPCNECTKIIIQSGISEVVYYDDKNIYKDETKASHVMLKKANVHIRDVTGQCKYHIINIQDPIKNPDRKSKLGKEETPTKTESMNLHKTGRKYRPHGTPLVLGRLKCNL